MTTTRDLELSTRFICKVILLPQLVKVGQETHRFGIMPMWEDQPQENQVYYTFPTLEKAQEALPIVAKAYHETIGALISNLRETTEEAENTESPELPDLPVLSKIKHAMHRYLEGDIDESQVIRELTTILDNEKDPQ